MSEAQQPIIITVEGRHYDINKQSDDTKEHYVESVNVKKEMKDLQAQINMSVQRLRTLGMALNERQRLLKASVINDGKNQNVSNTEGKVVEH